MSDDRREKRPATKRRVQLPDGTWGVYMGETGKGPAPRRQTRTVGTDGNNSAGKNVLQKAETRPGTTRPAPHPNARPDYETIASVKKDELRASQGLMSRYSLSADERRAAEERKKIIRERRAAANADIHNRVPDRAPEEKKFYHRILDRLHMWHLGISVNIESIIKALVIGVLILFFAMLQITVFSKLRPFGATPDLMLPLVIAIGITEGERWGGVSALAAAFLIDCLGSAGITLLPLLYVPCGFIAGILGTYYLRDSVVIRVIFSIASGVLRAIFTVIYVYITFSAVNAGLMFKNIVFPEFFSTLVFSVLPHLISWLSMKPFHKTRAERVD